MPVPPEYQRASQDFDAFLADARDSCDLVTTHQAFTVVQGVFLVFRRRLGLSDALAFAGALPPVLRALYVEGWSPDEPRRPFADLETMTAEVRSLRPAHNFAPDTAIHDVAVALRRHVPGAALEAVLAQLPPGARDFWRA